MKLQLVVQAPQMSGIAFQLDPSHKHDEKFQMEFLNQSP